MYFDDCYDLLQNKVQIPISGFGKGIKSATKGVYKAMEVTRDKNGKWVAPWTDGKCIDEKPEYSAKGQSQIELNSREELLNLMKVIEATRTAKSHALNDRSSRSHCLVTIKLTRKKGNSVQTSKFTFVDLAGSERINKTGVTDVK